MIKAVFFDMDETLCATEDANQMALTKMAIQLATAYPALKVSQFCERYLAGVYKQLNDEFPHLAALLNDEMAFRCELIVTLFKEQGLSLSLDEAKAIQESFDDDRMSAFDFYPNLATLVANLREKVKVGVITNGPVFSQLPKIDAVKLRERVDFVIVGGEEPEEKPALSIFEKALRLADCTAEEAIHIGDSLRCDIGGATNAGIRSVWVESKKATDHQALDDGKFSPTWRVAHPSDLPALLLPMFD